MDFKKLSLILLVSSFFFIPVAYGMEEDKQQIVHTKPKVEQRLKELGIELPVLPKGNAKFVPFKIVNSTVYISGQLPVCDGTLQYKGKLGKELSIEEGQEAAKLCTYNVLTYLKEACKGDLDRVQEGVELLVLVNSTDDFILQPQVANAASELINTIFGDNGQHTRAAFSSNSLPSGAAVEIKAIFKLKETSKL
jgi:enamine deaminase RidA (YjgF/YER057c/UK114 family)